MSHERITKGLNPRVKTKPRMRTVTIYDALNKKEIKGQIAPITADVIKKAAAEAAVYIQDPAKWMAEKAKARAGKTRGLHG